MKRIGFVTPWFGENIPGGAEMAARDLTRHLFDAGVELEILTTCIEKFASDWSRNFYPRGEGIAAGMPVRRFRVRKRDTGSFDAINFKFMNHVPVSQAEEDVYLKEMINCPGLYAYMNKHKDEYSLFVFIPYMFGTTYYGIQACPEKSVLIPCLHDESYAYMTRFKELFPKLRGMIFLAQPEFDLANRVYDLSHVDKRVLGIGVDTDIAGNTETFRQKYGVASPFILYAGRKDTGKNVHTLLAFFAAYKKKNPGELKLVLIGGGNICIPLEIKSDVIDLGFVPVQDKYNAYAAAEFLCQPSLNESFSLVIMESWICGRPVLVSDGCAVTKYFAEISNGGLYFSDYQEFAGCVDYILSHSEQAAAMGESGRRFVLDNFSWDVIIKKYVDFFEQVNG